MTQTYFLLVLLFASSAALTLLPLLFLHPCLDRHFTKPIKVPKAPLKRRSTFSKQNRLKDLPAAPQPDSEARFAPSAQKYAIDTPPSHTPSLSLANMIDDSKRLERQPIDRHYQTSIKQNHNQQIRPMPQFGDFSDVPEVEVSEIDPEVTSTAKPSAPAPLPASSTPVTTTVTQQPKLRAEKQIQWKTFYCLQNYISQMGKFYLHLRCVPFRRKRQLPNCCHYFCVGLLYLTPIISLFCKFDGGWSRALRGFIFSIRIHFIAAFLLILKVSVGGGNFAMIYGLSAGLLLLPTSLWKLLFVPKFGNLKANKKISLGLLRALPVLEKSHSFRYANACSVLIQVLLAFLYLGATSFMIIYGERETSETQTRDVLIATGYSVGAGVFVIGPLAAALNALILSCSKKEGTCCGQCLRGALVSEDMREMENDLVLLRNLWQCEATTSQEYHAAWKKGVLGTVATF